MVQITVQGEMGIFNYLKRIVWFMIFSMPLLTIFTNILWIKTIGFIWAVVMIGLFFEVFEGVK